MIRKGAPIILLLLLASQVLESQELLKPVLKFTNACASNSFNMYDVEVTYIAATFNSDNTFTLELSDACSDFTSNNEFVISETRFYTIAVKDSRGCLVSLVIEGIFIDIDIPNFFTPNGNGKHDYWYPKKVKDYHNIEVKIYDRYSRLLKTYTGIVEGWDGLYNNRPLPSGDYWYVIYYNQTPQKRRRLMGNFTLYR
ncbi:T9SS type B sorting domain-containing protein [Polaribacter sp.]|uniref:T9SS type B sorting domain-containing protein n=1 Tax=Polaribacter sp. TaxID=1920175 RepID=UPI003F69F8BD